MSRQAIRYPAMALLVALLCLSAPPATFALDGQLNLNTATVEQLEMLPAIGQVRAKAISDYRRQHGPFRSVDQLLSGKLIGESALAAVRPYLILSGTTTLHDGSPSKGSAARNRIPFQDLPPSRHLSLRPGEMQVLADGNYFPALLQGIGEARQHIAIAMFLFKTGDTPDNRPAQLARALIDARRRGVRIEVLLEKSGYDEEVNRENEKTAQLLRNNRIDVRFDSPETTTHAKLVVIDGHLVFVGSHNLTQAALTHNHEVSLLIDDIALARETMDYLATIH